MNKKMELGWRTGKLSWLCTVIKTVAIIRLLQYTGNTHKFFRNLLVENPMVQTNFCFAK